jgi:hypothetical protein
VTRTTQMVKHQAALRGRRDTATYTTLMAAPGSPAREVRRTYTNLNFYEQWAVILGAAMLMSLR